MVAHSATINDVRVVAAIVLDHRGAVLHGAEDHVGIVPVGNSGKIQGWHANQLRVTLRNGKKRQILKNRSYQIGSLLS